MEIQEAVEFMKEEVKTLPLEELKERERALASEADEALTNHNSFADFQRKEWLRVLEARSQSQEFLARGLEKTYHEWGQIVKKYEEEYLYFMSIRAPILQRIDDIVEGYE